MDPFFLRRASASRLRSFFCRKCSCHVLGCRNYTEAHGRWSSLNVRATFARSPVYPPGAAPEPTTCFPFP